MSKTTGQSNRFTDKDVPEEVKNRFSTIGTGFGQPLNIGDFGTTLLPGQTSFVGQNLGASYVGQNFVPTQGLGTNFGGLPTTFAPQVSSQSIDIADRLILNSQKGQVIGELPPDFDPSTRKWVTVSERLVQSNNWGTQNAIAGQQIAPQWPQGFVPTTFAGLPGTTSRIVEQPVEQEKKSAPQLPEDFDPSTRKWVTVSSTIISQGTPITNPGQQQAPVEIQQQDEQEKKSDLKLPEDFDPSTRKWVTVSSTIISQGTPVTNPGQQQAPVEIQQPVEQEKKSAPQLPEDFDPSTRKWVTVSSTIISQGTPVTNPEQQLETQQPLLNVVQQQPTPGLQQPLFNTSQQLSFVGAQQPLLSANQQIPLQVGSGYQQVRYFNTPGSTSSHHKTHIKNQ